MSQLSLYKQAKETKDIVYTPEYVAKKIIRLLGPTGKILDPCKGDGAFYNNFQVPADYCEIEEGKDFFECYNMYDWIIGNPPYSLFEEFLYKAFLLADNVSFLVPTNKIFQRQKIMDMINNYGGIQSIIIFGSGTLIDFPFGFSVGNFHFRRCYKGETRLIMGMKEIFA